MLNEFKDFIRRGNVLNLAVGVVVGVAFGKIVNSFVEDLLMPVLSSLVGDIDFSNLFIILSDSTKTYQTLADAQADGIVTFNYGVFVTNILYFLIIMFALFIIVKVANKLQNEKPAEVTEKECPDCCTQIPIKAKRCPNCTSMLEE